MAIGAVVLLAGGIAAGAMFASPNPGAGDDAASTAAEATPTEQSDPESNRGTSEPARVVGEVAAPIEPVDAIEIDDIDDQLVVVDGKDNLFVLDFDTGSRTAWPFPEQLANEPPVAVEGSVIVLGVSRAWVRPLPATTDAIAWTDLGPADKVRFSTKPDRAWLRTVHRKTDPTDAKFLWSEVDLTGDVQRSMFRNRPLWFPTPEFILGLGSNIFRFTDLEINPWRLYSSFGVPIAVGRNDLVANECNTRIECGRVWYDLASGEKKSSIHHDLAQAMEATYGTLLSPDGRFLISELRRPGAPSLSFVRSVATSRVVANNCLWETPIAWSSGSELLACRTADGIELHRTAPRLPGANTANAQPLARLAIRSDAADVAFAFVSNQAE